MWSHAMKETVSPIERPDFPVVLRERLLRQDWSAVSCLGDLNLLNNRLLGLLCSTRCPGEIILRSYDLACAIRDAGITVIGGFHSPMEQECFEILARGSQPVVVCPARGLQAMRIPGAWRTPLKENRLLVISPFPERERRPTAELARRRNTFVADLADELLVLHASPGGKIEELCMRILDRGRRVHLLEGAQHEALFKRGVRAESINEVVGQWRAN